MQKDILVEKQYEREIPGPAKGAVSGSLWLVRRVWPVAEGGGWIKIAKDPVKALKDT